MAVPAAFDGFIEFNKRVTSTCLITHENNRYSVPASFANRRVHAERLVIVAEASVIAIHERVFSRDHSVSGRTVYDWRHYLSAVQRRPGALPNDAPFAELPESFKRLQSQLLKHPGGDREIVDVLALVLLHNKSLVEQAVAESLKLEWPSKQHVLNCLNRLREPIMAKPTAPLRVPGGCTDRGPGGRPGHGQDPLGYRDRGTGDPAPSLSGTLLINHRTGHELEKEKLAGIAGHLANRLTNTDLVILDELGYLPFSQAGSTFDAKPGSVLNANQ